MVYMNNTNITFGDTNKYPVVGVLIPNYCHGHVIKKAIESVAKQDYPNKLIIIIDDCSTDDSIEIIKSLFVNTTTEIQNDDNTIYINDIENIPTILISLKENKKQANARNQGIKYTYDLCDYYCQLDADDEYLPNKLSKCMEVALQDRNNIGLVYHDVIIRNNLTGVMIEEYREPYSYERLLQECIICNTALINKKAISEMPYENISPVEDWGLWLDIAYSHMCIHIPEFLSIYNVMESSCTFTVDKKVWNDGWNKIREKIAKRHNLPLQNNA